MTVLAVFLVAFLASAVEMVEAATIVLAMEATRGTKAALSGALAGLLLLAVIAGVFGPVLASIPLKPLRLVVGTLGLMFGLDWLRKAILRSAGRKALHDETAIYATEVALGKRSASDPTSRIDRVGFIVSFKGVLLEGLEVIVIVLTLGSAQHQLDVAVIGALVALCVVTAVAAVLRKPLARVPENAMKLVVGVMLVSFGTFWSSEGAGVKWPGGDVSILGLVCWYGVVASIAIRCLQRSSLEKTTA